ncbi:MAG: iron chelate uptake ABC transporter family permease subunit [Flavobacteriales bacterium]
MMYSVIFGVALLGLASGLIGSFTFLRKQALIGDAIAHSVFPGIALGFMLSQSQDPIYLILGACFTGYLSITLVDVLTRYSKLKTDTAIALVLSVFFGFGVLLFTHIQHEYQSAQTGLDKFLFGKAAAMLKADLYWLASISGLIILAIVAFFRNFLLLSFDRAYAKTIGMNVKLSEWLLSVLTILVIVVGIQVVGIVLMAALLVTPASSARFWTNNLKSMLILSALFAMCSGLLGVLVSMSAVKMPTGPWIVIFLSFFAIFSILFSPKKGLFSRLQKRKNIRNKMLEDNILKTIYHLGEAQSDFLELRQESAVLERRYFDIALLRKGIKTLKQQGFLSKNSGIRLTDKGLTRAKRIVKLHRLWEMYLSTKLKVKGDHVHEDADTIEHFINDELEAELEQLLDFPVQDPHQNQIPYN